MNCKTLNRLEQLANDAGASKNGCVITSDLPEEFYRSLNHQRRPLFKKGKTFGLNVKRWYTIYKDSISFYHSNKSAFPSSRKSLDLLKFCLPQVDKKENLPCIKLVFEGHSTVWLTANNEEEKQLITQHINSYITPSSNTTFDKQSCSSAQPRLETANKAENAKIKSKDPPARLITDAPELPEDEPHSQSIIRYIAAPKKNNSSLTVDTSCQSITTPKIRKPLNFDRNRLARCIPADHNLGLATDPEISEGLKNKMVPFQMQNCSDLKKKISNTYSQEDDLCNTSSLASKNRTQLHVHTEHTPVSRHIRSHSNELREPGSFSINKLFSGGHRDSLPRHLLSPTLDLDASDTNRFQMQMSSARYRSKLPSTFVNTNPGHDLIDSNTLSPFGPKIIAPHPQKEKHEAIGAEDALLTQVFESINTNGKLGNTLSNPFNDTKNFPTYMENTLPTPLTKRKPGLRRSVLNALIKEISDKYPKPSSTSIDVPASLQNGFALLNNFELKDAKEAFESLASKDYTNTLFVIECEAIQLLLSGSKQQSRAILQKFDNYLQFLKDRGAPEKKDYSAYFSHELAKADCLVQRSMISGSLGHRFQGFMNLSEAWGIYRRLELMQQNAAIAIAVSAEAKHRVNFGVGVFNFLIAQLPSRYLRVIRLISITPNKNRGLAKLQACWKEEGPRKLYAGLILATYYAEITNELGEASNIVERALTEYPKCVLFLWLGGVISWKYFQVGSSASLFLLTT